MADYPDIRPDAQAANIRPTPGYGAPQPSTNVQVSQRSSLGPALVAAAVVIVVGVVAWYVLGDREVVTPPVPASETTAPATPDTSPGVVPAPTPPEATPEPAPAPVPDTTPGIVPEGDPAPDLPPVGDPPAAPQTGTTPAPSN